MPVFQIRARFASFLCARFASAPHRFITRVSITGRSSKISAINVIVGLRVSGSTALPKLLRKSLVRHHVHDGACGAVACDGFLRRQLQPLEHGLNEPELC